MDYLKTSPQFEGLPLDMNPRLTAILAIKVRQHREVHGHEHKTNSQVGRPFDQNGKGVFGPNRQVSLTYGADLFEIIKNEKSGKDSSVSPTVSSLRGVFKHGEVAEKDYKRDLEEKYL